MSDQENEMDAVVTQNLTKRQRSVMERIDRRVPIKVIANELGVSETRINQHIRALKDIYRAESLNELVMSYRTSKRFAPDRKKTQAYINPVYSKKQLPEDEAIRENHDRVVSPDSAGGSSADTVQLVSKQMALEEPRVVPGVLDGEHAVLLRLAIIVGIAFGILAAVVLSVTAALALSEAMDGLAAVPVED